MAKANAVVPATEYAIMGKSIDKIQAVIKKNCGPRGIDPSILDKIKVGSSDNTLFPVPTSEGTVGKKELVGIILGWSEPRALFDKPFAETGGKEPPLCSSLDGIKGFGDPFNEGESKEYSCLGCPWDEWGTAIDDKGNPAPGKKCRQRRILWLIDPEGFIPYMVIAPATSMKNCSTYFLHLGRELLGHDEVITKMSLSTSVSGQGVKFPMMNFEKVENIDEENLEKIRALQSALMPYLMNVSLEGEDLKE